MAEKILADGETLPDDWPVAGTTGYGFMNVLNGLFVEGANNRALIRAYEHSAGRREPFATERYRSKRLIMTSSLASELAVLTRALKQIAAADRATRDFTLTALQRALIETVRVFSDLSHVRHPVRISPRPIAMPSTSPPTKLAGAIPSCRRLYSILCAASCWRSRSGRQRPRISMRGCGRGGRLR